MTEKTIIKVLLSNSSLFLPMITQLVFQGHRNSDFITSLLPPFPPLFHPFSLSFSSCLLHSSRTLINTADPGPLLCLKGSPFSWDRVYSARCPSAMLNVTEASLSLLVPHAHKSECGSRESSSRYSSSMWFLYGRKVVVGGVDVKHERQNCWSRLLWRVSVCVRVPTHVYVFTRGWPAVGSTSKWRRVICMSGCVESECWQSKSLMRKRLCKNKEPKKEMWAKRMYST